MLKFNYHSHSTYCDGKNTLEEMVLSAIDKGLKYFGFSAHSPVPFENDFGLQPDEIPNYLGEIKRLKKKYEDKIQLFASMEFDYIPNLSENIKPKAKKYGLDYTIAAVHMVYSEKGLWFIDGSKQETYDEGLKKCFDNNIKEAVRAFFYQNIKMIQEEKPDIVGHFDKVKMHNKDRYFKEDEPWYKDLVMQTIEEIKQNDLICEINTRGLYKGRSDDYFPQTSWIKTLAQEKVRVTVSTDCHKADEVDKLFIECSNHLKDCGHKEIWYFDGSWKPTPL